MSTDDDSPSSNAGTASDVDVMLVGYFPPTGAIAELFAAIAAALAGVARTAVLAPADAGAMPAGLVADIRFPYSSRRPERAVLGAGYRAHRTAARLRPSVVLLFTQHPLNVLAALHLRRSRLTFWWHEPVFRGQAGLARRLTYRSHDLVIAPLAERIVVAAASVERDVPPRYRGKVAVVPFPRPQGFDTDSGRFAADPTDLAFFGKLAPYKGLDVLADAIDHLASDGRRPTLRVVGAGALELAAPRLASLAARHRGVVDHVDEYASGHDVVSALRSSRLCVLPYLSAAGSSTIAVVGGTSVPLVASRCGAFEDELVDGEHAVLVEPGDAVGLAEGIAALLADPERRSAVGDALHELTEQRYSAPRVAAQLLTAIARGPDDTH